MKSIFFRHYILIAMIMTVTVILAAIMKPHIVKFEIVVTALGGIFSSAYFVQKQKLEELRLFKELFTEFNHRYDQMNEKLNKILQGTQNEKLTEQEINYLYDYFNLCGEEYLYYKQGYILPEVWESWKNGMRTFSKNNRIRELWEDELKENSYYCFKLNLLD